ncbi:NB-ARC domain-containing protein [Streptomyces sp. NBC_00178]|uniref:AfsR/SARP family transcriptional regulator n=1 Tax=Streptomyces sp. NBC_00178 TaxID=2975672 RepID=UPI002E2CE846|nr:BTAD domain-containing putative transcriptional regulator [Streptomyces sp. NBC_00178]
MTIEFGMLGEVQARVGATVVDLGPARQRWVLAALLVDVNSAVPVHSLVSRVWGVQPPSAAKSTLYSYLSRLRQALGAVAEASASGAGIERRPGGYVILTDPDRVDLHRFRALVRQARAGEDERSTAQFEQALQLWRGEPFATLDTPWCNSIRESLLEERHACLLDRNDVLLRHGEHAALLSELASCFDGHALDERLAAQYMLALYRSGRPADALRCFDRIRCALADELGTNPSPELMRRHQQVLTNDPAIATPADALASSPAADDVLVSGVGSSRDRIVPRQLPSSGLFVGRGAEMAELDKVLGEVGRSGGPAVVCAISGSGGVGKTSLAVHWARQAMDRFPDGQLYVDLHGFTPSGEPLAPASVVRGFLDALGVESGSIPADQQSLGGLYRTLVADRRMLVVLDNARDVDQVKALVPGGAGCMVLVTSRRRLTGLAVTHGAHLLPLDVLTPGESRELLGRHLGEGRMAAADPAAVTAVLDHCAGLPLAVSVAGARAAAGNGPALAALAEELQDQSARLDALDAGDLSSNVRAVCHVSYRSLTERAAKAFRLLGAAGPAPDIGLAAVAALLGQPLSVVGVTLRELETVHLVQQPTPGRYGVHDLIRLYAAEMAVEEQTQESCERALRRLMDFYLHTGYACDLILSPFEHHVLKLEPALDGVTVEPPADQMAVMSWFRIEHAGLVAAQRAASLRGWDRLAWQMARVVDGFLWRQGRLHDHLALWHTGLAAAERLGEGTARAWAHRRLAHASARAGRHDRAVHHADLALAAAEEAADTAEQARIHDVIAWSWARQGDDQKALGHVQHTLRLQRQSGDPLAQANALNAVGWYEARLGDYGRALTHCEEGLEIHRRHGFRDGEACTLDSLGFIAHAAGRHEEALAHYEHARVLFHDLGNFYEEANTLANLGDVHMVLRQPGHARDQWRQAADLFRVQHRAEEAGRMDDKSAAVTD